MECNTVDEIHEPLVRRNEPNFVVVPLRVVNILGLNISASSQDVADFKDQQDHSKWAIQNSRGSTTWACVGDINRMVNITFDFDPRTPLCAVAALLSHFPRQHKKSIRSK
jgi:Deoxyribonuclease II